MHHGLSVSLRPAPAADALGVSKATLLRWERDKPDFPKPSRPTPRVTLYDRDELLAWRDSHKAVLAEGAAA